MSDDADRRPGEKVDEKAGEKVKDKMSKDTSCEEVRENLDAYLDGELAAELPADGVTAFEAHLASCEECLARLERRKALVGLVAALPVPKAPPRLAEKILAAAVRGAPAGGRKPSFVLRLRTWAPALAAAAVLVLAVFIGLNAPRHEHAPDDYALAEAAREAEAPAPPSVATPRPGRVDDVDRSPTRRSRFGNGATTRRSLDTVAAKAESREGVAPREALVRKAVAERRREKGARIAPIEIEEAARGGAAPERVLAERAVPVRAALEKTAPGAPPDAASRRSPARAPAVAMKKSGMKKGDVKEGAWAAPPEPAAARDARGVGEAPPAVADAIRLEKKQAAPAPAPALPRALPPAEKRALAAKGRPPARARVKSAAKAYPRGGVGATGEPYRPERGAATATGRRYDPRAAEQVLGRREEFDEDPAEGLADRMQQVGRSVVVPQVNKIARQAATGRRERERETGRIVLSEVVGVRGRPARDRVGQMVARIPIATPDALATQRLIVALVHETGGVIVGRISGVVSGPGARRPGGGFALSGRRGKSPGEGGQASPAAARTALNVPPFTVKAAEEKVVVRIPGPKAERFLRKIDGRFGDVTVEYAAVVEEIGGEPRRVYRAIYRGSVLEKLRENLPRLRSSRLVTVEFPLISPAEAAQIEAAQIEAAEAEAARAKAATRALLRGAQQSEPPPAGLEAEQSPTH